jgi:processive 1,2-diacylglycerol beta-glucosyltransferase
MKVLIVTMTCGEGHNAIARSLKDGFAPEDEVKIVNLYEHLGKKDPYGKAYLFSVKHFPKVFTALWNYARKIDPDRRYRGLAMQGILKAADEMERVALEFQPDAVLCTHNQASNVFCWLKIHNRFQGKIYSIFFDYVTCPYWEGSVLCDAIFTPHEITHAEILSRGFRAEQLFAYGFPVNPKYDKVISKSEARAALGIAEDDFVVLTVNGGMGVGNIGGLVKQFSRIKKGGKNLCVLTVCGSNRKAYGKVSRIVKKRKLENVRVFGFVDNLDVMLSAADLFFCRGGGGAVSESLMKGVLFVVREKAVAQEYLNGKLFSSLGICYVMKRLSDTRKILKEAMRLQNDKQLNSEISDYVRRGSVEKIVNHIKSFN